MAKIVKFESKDPYKGKVDAFVAFDDKKFGFFNYPEGPAPFKEGDYVTYQITDKTLDSGKKIHIITSMALDKSTPPPSPSEKAPVSGKSFEGNGCNCSSKTMEDRKVEAAYRAMTEVFTAVCADKVDISKVPLLQREYAQLLWDEIDEIFGKK